jgi:hypothetical protein
MRTRFGSGLLVAAAIVVGFLSGAAQPTAGQAPAAAAYKAPRTLDGKPSLAGIWQVLNTASVDVLAHNASEGAPAGLGVVDGNLIPYTAAAAAKKQQNFEARMTEDPLRKCFLAGVPRITYMPFPLQIVQTPTHVGIAYEYNHASRIIYTNGTEHSGVDDFWMGDSRGHWEGETLVVDVNGFNDKTWFDQTGNHHSDKLHVIERYTRTGPDVIAYEATIEDPGVFTRPWKMSMPLYRRQEKNIRLLDYVCLEFREQSLSIDELVKTKK